MPYENEEFLAKLKDHMLWLEAQAMGAREAYERERYVKWRSQICDAGLKIGDKVVVNYKDGSTKQFILKDVSGSFRFNGPALFGRRILKSGKPSAAGWNEEMCALRDIGSVKKAIA